MYRLQAAHVTVSNKRSGWANQSILSIFLNWLLSIKTTESWHRRLTFGNLVPKELKVVRKSTKTLKVQWPRLLQTTMASVRLEHERPSQVDEERNFNYELKKSSPAGIWTHSTLMLYHLCYLIILFQLLTINIMQFCWVILLKVGWTKK